ncbi:hypothetical protein AMATHDRAFT_8160 [Amanita thiersii Skay4041]|uniref:Methyltransferase domain-containing protein n=1 Tax=Amanita thiersii Skay4041 TaxID=703135 RepID=A0A2A9NER5_9AGAR|nr:hypothetical protein AMATHDRAFT_8160 [Amanita thiersii Skay4041]
MTSVNGSGQVEKVHRGVERAEMEKLIRAGGDDAKVGWDSVWKARITPWDIGASHPALQEVVEEGEINFPKGSDKKALVPGCGSGYDVVYLATQLGVHATGLDIAPTAIERAISLASTLPDAAIKERISFKGEDFFRLNLKGEFDLIYDYTFFVAISPTMRSEWGRQMANLIKPGGYLITLAFPIEPKRDVGPPFYVRPDHYDEPLGDAFKKVYDNVPKRFPPGREGKQHMMVWQKV